MSGGASVVGLGDLRSQKSDSLMSVLYRSVSHLYPYREIEKRSVSASPHTLERNRVGNNILHRIHRNQSGNIPNTHYLRLTIPHLIIICYSTINGVGCGDPFGSNWFIHSEFGIVVGHYIVDSLVGVGMNHHQVGCSERVFTGSFVIVIGFTCTEKQYTEKQYLEFEYIKFHFLTLS